MRLEHHLVGGYVRYISPHIIIIIIINVIVCKTGCTILIQQTRVSNSSNNQLQWEYFYFTAIVPHTG